MQVSEVKTKEKEEKEVTTWTTTVRDSISVGEVLLYILGTFCLGAAFRIPNLMIEGTSFYIIAGAACLIAAIFVRSIRIVRRAEAADGAL